jgi:hypothetical protein
MFPTQEALPPARSAWNAAASREANEALAGRIEGSIERKACGRIRDLRVVCQDGVITIEGRTRTYHAKQLAQEAALDLADGQPALANLIVVC